MKQLMIAALAAFALLSTAWATETVDGVEYSYLTFASYGDPDVPVVSWIVAVMSIGTEKDVVIPSKLGGYPVTRIGNGSFKGQDLKSVTIPDSVTAIGENAFKDCTSLERVEIPSTVEHIDKNAFSGCTALKTIDVAPDDTERVSTLLAGSGYDVNKVAFVEGDPEATTWFTTKADAMAKALRTGKKVFMICGRDTCGNTMYTKNVACEDPKVKTELVAKCVLWYTNCDTQDDENYDYWPYGEFTLPVVCVIDPNDPDKWLVQSTGPHTGDEVLKLLAGIPSVKDGGPRCTVTFNANGGSVAPFTTSLVKKDTAIGSLPEPTLGGYIFGGWFTAAEGGNEVTSATVVTADMTIYAHWIKATEATWFTKKADAMAEALRTGKMVFMICGRDTCPNTMATKNKSCEEPKVKAELVAKCVLWYSNCDTQEKENYCYYPTGSFSLPLVCIIDPNDPDKWLVRSTGYLTGEDVLDLLEDIPYPDTIGDPMNPGEQSWYNVLNAKDIWAPYSAPKAVTLLGAAYNGSRLAGIVELKLGKVSKAMTSKISGTVTLLDGKKCRITAQTVNVDDKLAISVKLDVRGLGVMKLAIGGKQFAGAIGRWHVQSANVGGSWTKSSATATIRTGDVAMFQGRVLENLLPTNEVATISRGKWSFPKAATVKWTKLKPGMVPIEQDVASGKGLVIDTSKGKTNLSGLKLTYTPKNGTFKGSFKVFTLQSGKLKKYTVNVSGVVVDGIGYGAATCKKPAVTWQVLVQ